MTRAVIKHTLPLLMSTSLLSPKGGGLVFPPKSRRSSEKRVNGIIPGDALFLFLGSGPGLRQVKWPRSCPVLAFTVKPRGHGFIYGGAGNNGMAFRHKQAFC